MTTTRSVRSAWERAGATDVLGTGVEPLLAAAAVAVGAWPWLRGYRVAGAEPLLLGAAILPVVIPFVVGRFLRQPALSSFALSLIGLVGVLLAAAGLHPAAISDAVAHDTSQLLTATLPLTGGRTLLVVPLAVVWLTGAATAEILTRARRPAGALVVPVVGYLAAFAATAGAPRRDDTSGAVLLAVLAVLAVAVRRDGDRYRTTVDLAEGGGAGAARRTARRALVGATVAVVLAAGLAVGVPRVHALAGAQTSLRRHPATAAALLDDPVDAVASLRDASPAAPATPLLSLTTSAPSSGYVGVADLDDYDGSSWTFDTTFEPTGGRVPPAPEDGPGSTTTAPAAVEQRYRLLGSYPLPFVPTIDRPVDVDGLAIDADAATGGIVPAATLTTPATYTVVSRAPVATFGRLPGADTFERGPGDAADLALPAVPTTASATIVRFEESLTGQRPFGTVPFLQALVGAMRSGEQRLVPSATGTAPPSHGGTSLAEVVDAVAVDRRATPEQFATFVAVAARLIGIPARLVTGFRVVATSSSPPLAPGTVTVTNREAWTWVEVPVVGVGWVVVDATPAQTVSAAAPPPPAGSTTATTLAPPKADAVPQAGGPGGNRAVAPRVRPHLATSPHRTSPWRRDLLVAVLAVVALLALGPLVAATRRWARRRPRRADDAAALAVGAWLELLDALEVAGMPAPRQATSSEILSAASAAFGAEALAGADGVAATAERALCSPGDPPDVATAAAAWATQRTIRRRIVRSLPLRRRVRALVSVGDQPRRPADGPGRRPRPVAAAGRT